jgi:hypothetical protein
MVQSSPDVAASTVPSLLKIARQMSHCIGDEDPLRASVKLAQKANLL